MALTALGFEVVAMPVTTYQAVDAAPLVGALARADYGAVVVASARVARALAPHPRPSCPVWAVGPATGRALVAAGGFEVVAHPSVHDAASLGRELASAHGLRHRRILVPRAEDGRDEAIAVLRAAHFEVDVVTVYRTVVAAADDPAVVHGRDLLTAGLATVGCVFAPSQATALATLLDLPAIVTRWVAIGATTANALRAVGATAVAVALTPTPEGIANAVTTVYPAER